MPYDSCYSRAEEVLAEVLVRLLEIQQEFNCLLHILGTQLSYRGREMVRYVCMYVCMCVCIYNVCICVYVCVYVCMYSYHHHVYRSEMYQFTPIDTHLWLMKSCLQCP